MQDRQVDPRGLNIQWIFYNVFSAIDECTTDNDKDKRYKPISEVLRRRIG